MLRYISPHTVNSMAIETTIYLVAVDFLLNRLKELLVEKLMIPFLATRGLVTGTNFLLNNCIN